MKQKNMSRRWVRWVLVTLILVAILVYIIAILQKDCYRRNNETPTHPVFPQSTLVKEDIPESSLVWTYISRTYSSNTSPLAIAEFYSEYGDCQIDEINQTIICRGNAEPFGNYEIPIQGYSLDTIQDMEFDVVTQWDLCETNTF